MRLYLGIVFVILIVLALSITKDAKNENKGKLLKSKDALVNDLLPIRAIFVIIMGFFWFLTAFRAYNIGNDTHSYVRVFNNIAKDGIISNLYMEIGFQYFCLLISKISSNPRFFLFVNATICYVAVAIYILKYSKNILFSLVLFFCFFFSDFTTMLRQNLAMIIVLYAYQALKNKKNIKFFLMVVFASLFHTTAWFALLLYFHKWLPNKIWKSILIIVCCVILSATGLIAPLITKLFSAYESYFESVFVGTGWLGVGVNLLRNAMLYLIMHSIYQSNKDEKLPVWSLFLYLILTSFAFTMNQFLRSGKYFLMITMVDLPNALTTRKLKDENVIILILGIIFCMYFLITLRFRPEWNSIYPYKFYWNS